MLDKDQLVRRNVKDTIVREPVYFFTMVLIAAMMSAFDPLFFSKEVQKNCETVLFVFLGTATILIAMVTAWLVYHMMRRSLKVRSRELGLYMLFGVEKAEISRIIRKEMILMAGMAYIPGIVAGKILEQFLMVIFFHMFRTEYVLMLDLRSKMICFTAMLYLFCHLPALLKVKKTIKKMDIRQLNEGQEINGSGIKRAGRKYKRHRVRKWLLKGDRLFLCRAIGSEMYTMRKKIVSVMLFLTIAIAGSTVAMMYTDYQNHQIDSEYPFDVMIYHQTPKPEFWREKAILEREAGIQSSHGYIIYQDGSSVMNEWLYMHLMYFGDCFISGDGTFDPEGLETDAGDYDVYYPYDTYMKVSDYNVLLQMLGEKPVRLRGDGYILQIKRRLEPELTDEIRGRTLLCGQKELHCQGVRTVDLGQNGHNGADYVLVIPDDAADHMAPYYSVLAAFTDEEVTGALFDRLKDVSDGDEGLYWESNHSILYVSPILLKKQVETKLKATIVPFIFSCAYVSIVFLCVSISFFASHLIPLGMALIPGCLIAYRASKGFILATGLRTVWVRYVLLSFLWVLMLYILYFILTDIFFRRNIHHGKDGGLL